MREFLNCPSCGARLWVPEGAAGPWFTCPRCLARVEYAVDLAAITTGPRVSGGRSRSVDADVTRDGRGFGCGISVLLALLSVGIA